MQLSNNFFQNGVSAQCIFARSITACVTDPCILHTAFCIIWTLGCFCVLRFWLLL